MGKVTIDAQQATADIRAGFNETTLMKKYHLTARGLDSLLSKLVAAGFLQQSEIQDGRFTRGRKRGLAPKEVPAKQILGDLKSGMMDTDLMQKYKISAKGLRSLYEQLEIAGLLSEAELDDSAPHLESTVEIGAQGFVIAAQELGPVSKQTQEAVRPVTSTLDLSYEAPSTANGPTASQVKETVADRSEAGASEDTLSRRPFPEVKEWGVQSSTVPGELGGWGAKRTVVALGETIASYSKPSLLPLYLRWFGAIQLVLGVAYFVGSLLWLPSYSGGVELLSLLARNALPLFVSVGLFFLFLGAAEGLELPRDLAKALDKHNLLLEQLLERTNQFRK